MSLHVPLLFSNPQTTILNAFIHASPPNISILMEPAILHAIPVCLQVSHIIEISVVILVQLVKSAILITVAELISALIRFKWSVTALFIFANILVPVVIFFTLTTPAD